MRCRELRQLAVPRKVDAVAASSSRLFEIDARASPSLRTAPLAAPPIMSEIGPKSRPPLATELYAAGRLIGNKCFDENFEVCRAACAAHATLRSSGNCARGCAAHATLRRARHAAHIQAAQRHRVSPAARKKLRPLPHRAHAR